VRGEAAPRRRQLKRFGRRPSRLAFGEHLRVTDHERSFFLPFVDANGVSLHYAIAGASGPSVVLMHELGGTLRSWDAVAPKLAGRRRVLRYDQRGSGQSEKVRQEFSNDTLVADLEALLAATALPAPYHFVTVAAAATQSLRFLEQHPAQVGALVLCNPAPGVDPSRAAALDERAAFAAREGMRAALPTTLAISYPPTLGDPAAYRAYLGRYLANDPVCFGYAFRALARTNMLHMLPQIRCPAMVVAGRHDTVRPHAGTAELARKIPGARFELIEAGHFMPTQGPDALLAVLDGFLPA
jgi:3-oxoadipate enol-lactonase